MDFEYICTLSDEEIKEFVHELVEKLDLKKTDRVDLGYDNIEPYNGMIYPSMMVSNADSCFVIKNNEYLYKFFNFLKDKKIKTINEALNAVYSFINNYFGVDGNDEKKELLLNDREASDISVLEGQNAAMCTERAALAQNLFTVLGVESYFCVGTIRSLSETGLHAFNVIDFNGYRLYDAARQVPIYKGGKIDDYKFYMYPLEKEQFDKLLKSGESISIHDYVYVKKKKKNFPQVIGTRTYSTGLNLNLVDEAKII